MDITNSALIERQHLMMGLGMMTAQIGAMMNATDEVIAAQLTIGRETLAKLAGERADKAAKIVRALEIEAEIRGI